jgi:ATP-dependent DNA helicase DinG
LPRRSKALEAEDDEVSPPLLQTQAERAEGLEKCWQRAVELVQRLGEWQKITDLSYVRWAEAFSQSLATEFNAA